MDEKLAARYKPILASIIVAGALARILVIILFGDIDPATAQIWETGGLAIVSLKYGAITACICGPVDIASGLLGADGSELFTFPSAFVPPLPIFLFMAVFKIFGVSKLALSVLLAINVLGGSVVVYYCARIAETLFKSRTIAIIAALIAAFHPVLVYSAATYHGVNIYLPLILAIFDLCSSRYVPTMLRSVGLGVLFGVTILIRTEYLALGLAILGGALLFHRRIALTAVTLLVACCVVSPWTIRNYIVFDRFMPVVSTTGYALFKGFNPLANGSGHWVDFHGVAKQLIGKDLAAVPKSPHYEVEIDDVYHKAANDFIAKHPTQAFLSLPARKVALFWLFDFYDPTTHQIMYQLAFWPLLVTSLLGLVFAYKTGLFSLRDHRVVLLYFLAQTVVVVGYAVHARYRLNVEPFLFGYAALGIVALASWWLPRRSTAPSA
jgi:Dolichyl-phosphate-mannose-protein mannosyltransferase